MPKKMTVIFRTVAAAMLIGCSESSKPGQPTPSGQVSVPGSSGVSPTKSALSPVAVQLTSELAVFYLGQPGIKDFIGAIQNGFENLPYAWWRIAVPTPTGPTVLDLATSSGAEYWEHFTIAPGCSKEDGPWTGKWKAGTPGVSGKIVVQPEANGTYSAKYDFTYTGKFDTPCKATGTHSSGNSFVTPVEESK